MFEVKGFGLIEQTVTGMPSGTYTLSVRAKSSGASGARLYARNCGVEKEVDSIGSLLNWTEMSIDGIAPDAGNFTIGVSVTSDSVILDEFVLAVPQDK